MKLSYAKLTEPLNQSLTREKLVENKTYLHQESSQVVSMINGKVGCLNYLTGNFDTYENLNKGLYSPVVLGQNQKQV